MNRISFPSSFPEEWGPDTPALLFDIETDGLLDSLSRVHCVCARDWLTGETFSFGPSELDRGLELLSSAPLLVAHNGLCFDAPALAKLFPGLVLPPVFDTLLASRLIWTNLRDEDFARLRRKKGKKFPLPSRLAGSHSLEAWGLRLGVAKGDDGRTTPDAWAEWSPEMQKYCEQDVEVLRALYEHIIGQGYSRDALALEHEFQRGIFRQEQNGVLLDRRAANALYAELAADRQTTAEELQKAFPPRITRETFVPKASNRTYGYVKGVPVTREHVEVFNPASREQIAARLMEKYDWVPGEHTDTGQPKIDESVLSSLPWPEAGQLLHYLELEKIIGMLANGKAGWLRLVNEADDRIHGRVTTCGTVTGRCSHHSPNLAQIPARGRYGKACRALFIAPPGMVMVGADASGLELRMLAHYMGRYDGGAYAHEVVNGDIHTANQKAAGLESRDTAKTFIYAFLYGAGDEKLGSIVAPTASRSAQRKRGAALRARFLRNFPALRRLTDDIATTLKKRPYLVGLDGRLLHIRSAHSALNTLLQSAGAVLVKQATNIFHQQARWTNASVQQVLHVHDEAQFYTLPELADSVGRLFVQSIEQAGELFELRCPVTGEYKVGNNWSETH